MFVQPKLRIQKLKATAAMLLVFSVLVSPMPVFAGKVCGGGSTSWPNQTAYKTSIDLGCTGKGSPILDLMFAIIRFLSIGVGLVIVASMVYAGLQYIGSRGDPNANALAIKRIQSNVTALLLFVFAYAIINYVIPGQLLK